MSDSAKTLSFIVVAALLAFAAFYSAPSDAPPELFDDVGTEFFPNFTDPTSPASLEVLTYDSASAEVKPFKVENDGGRWTIPSHHSYPADAEKRMSKAAGIFIGLEKLDIRSNSKEHHAGCGVIDPEESTVDESGLGTKVTFKDGAGNQLASLIIGNDVEGRRGMNYVRIPGTNATYVAKLPEDLSTAFEDWIETDLLDVKSSDISKLTFDNYSINEETGLKEEGEVIVATKVGRDWIVSETPQGQETDKSAVSNVYRTLGRLKIVGVRPKPKGLTAQLAKLGRVELERRDLRSLQRRGFYFGSDGMLHSNEGDLLVETKKGIEYTLRFGEIIFGSGKAVTAGLSDESEEEPADTGEVGPPSPGEDEESSGASRYLMVTVRFVEELIEKPQGIGLSPEHVALRKEAQEEVERLVESVAVYQERNGELPASLTALTEGETPVRPSIPKDPWDADYVYAFDAEGGSFTVASYGEDRAQGGSGTGQDIASDRLDAEQRLQESADELAEYQSKVTEGREQAQKLRERFAPWYYVISDEEFQKLRKDRSSLLKAKEAEGG